jgi:hypothetical protein
MYRYYVRHTLFLLHIMRSAKNYCCTWSECLKKGPGIRYLLISLAQACSPTPKASGPSPDGDDDDSIRPGLLCHYRQRGYAFT